MSPTTTERSQSAGNPLMAAGKLVWKIFTSWALATVVLLFMFLLTLLGTLEQVEYGLHDTQAKYFDSLFVVHDFFGKIPVPLPGVMLLMWILFINLTLGALMKVRKRWKGIGMLIAHFGMILLLVGGFVGFKFKNYGNMALYEGETSDVFESYVGWQLEILPVNENGEASEALVIPTSALESINVDEQRVFTSEKLPFDVVINGYARNAFVAPERAPMAAQARSVDGFALLPQKPDTEAERNMGGAYLAFHKPDGSVADEAIVWAGADAPYTVDYEGKKYAVQLVREKWAVPFKIRLDDFHKEEHPGTRTARVYESTVTKIETVGDEVTEEKVKIEMNQPLRHRGYTFFQASFGPENAGPNERLFSVFAVMQNPADQWPLISLIVTGTGLLIHFVIMLVGFLTRETRRRSKEETATAVEGSAPIATT